MDIKNKIKKLEKIIRQRLAGSDPDQNPDADGFFTALNPNRDWKTFFAEHKGKDLEMLVLGEMTVEAWADYETDENGPKITKE